MFRNAASLDSIAGPSIPQEMIPDEVTDIMKSGKYQMM